MPESTTVTGLPGPGGVSPSMPITERHHSAASSGSGCVSRTDAAARSRSSSIVCRAWRARRPRASRRAVAAGRRKTRSEGATDVAPAWSNGTVSTHNAAGVSWTSAYAFPGIDGECDPRASAVAAKSVPTIL